MLEYKYGMTASPMKTTHPQSSQSRRLNNSFICRRRGDETQTSPVFEGKVRDSLPRLLLSQQSDRAFTLLEICVVISTVALLALLILPLFVRRTDTDYVRLNCMNNLKQVGLSFWMWGEDNGVYPMLYRTNNFDGPSYAMQQKMYVYFQAMSNELATPKTLVCRQDDTRTPGTNFTTDFDNSKVSYFVGLDAAPTSPTTFLAGDRHISNGISPRNSILELTTNQPLSWSQNLHYGKGNIALADGSAHGFNSSQLRNALRSTGIATNRIALP
jgi:prepilin-type processing-associated H-X9-DG protein